MNNPFIEMIELWISVKQISFKQNQWSCYKDVLEQSIKSLSIIYANGKEDWFLKALGKLIKLATLELKENMIKYNKIKVPF